HYSVFQRIIGQLATQFDAPVFEPHVTLFAGPEPECSCTGILGKVARGLSDIRATIGRAEASEQYTMSLFVRLRASEDLQRLADRIKTGSGTQKDYQFRPHLSLLYKDMSLDTKRSLIDKIEFPQEPVHFRALAALDSPALIRTQEDVKSWRVM